MLYEPIYELDPGAYGSITISTAAIGITAALLCPTSGRFAGMHAKAAFITIEGTATKNARFCQEGTTPTSSVGHEILPGDSLVVAGMNALANLKFIRSGDTDLTGHITTFF